MMKKVPCPECDGRGYFSKCKTWDYENGLSCCSTWDETCHRCNRTGLIEVPMTNADKIRAMSDEGLALYLRGVARRKCPHDDDCNNNGCWACWVEWLQQPCECVQERATSCKGGADNG